MNRDYDSALLRRRLSAALGEQAAFDAGTRALYATDASNYRQVPDAVVVPRTVEDVLATIAVCHDLRVPLVPRGGGTSVAGNALGGGVLLDTSRHLNRVLSIDPDRKIARVQPGVVLDDLRDAAAAYGLTFGPDPSTHSRCTLGGMIGNNACGSHSVFWGRTSDNVHELDIALADGTRMRLGRHPREELARLARQPGRPGEVFTALRAFSSRHLEFVRRRFSAFPRQISGYALEQLLPENGFHAARALVGSEGTCATVLEATVALVEAPKARSLLVLGYRDAVHAAEAVPYLLPHRPLTIEGLDHQLVQALLTRRSRLPVALPDGQAWLLVETGGDTARQSLDRARELAAVVEAETGATASRVVADPMEQRAFWRIREEGAGIATRMADGSEAWPGWEDAAVPPQHLPAYLRDFQRLLARHGLRGLVYGHFGEGCLHVRSDFDLLTRQGAKHFRAFIEQAAELVVAHGGSLSGEHGDGRARSELLALMYGEQGVRAFSEFKAIWDPDDLMNPGVLVRPRPLDENLRFLSQPAVLEGRAEPATVFGYPHDNGSFAQALRRCVGVGKCRNHSGGVMCPSYRATREEKHSTRGRAHLLAEMLSGEVVTGGWRSTEVRDALDLCLSCKGCKSDCPTNVDMATYKAEFLHHHYAGRLRPASHYSMGFLPVWARLATLAPGLVNAVGRSRLLSGVLKAAGGIARERDLPRFAPQNFLRWWRGRPAQPHADRPPVLLWPDTFNTYLTPEVTRDATEVLEDAGFRVVLPGRSVCCGLTWISTGQLGVARRVLRRTLRTLAGPLAEGMQVVGLEPSCAAVFRSDAVELLSKDDPLLPVARRLAERTRTLAEFLTEQAPDWSPPPMHRASIAQPHCHQHAVMGFSADERLLAAAGLDNRTLDAGCCGLAGNFGFERGHYEVSQAVGEQALLPQVRAAGPDTLVLADGFSCRTQIAQGSGRRALHLAQVLREALRHKV
ncbi:FAD-binding and (Fe-S)-binding domain-containing protein [Thermoactinospora rubra]|uniref:FAD-binding and (Fe-S)-binding domain-containing protein n=1 Tax=Thermoactinospora rubra TaxID=1088767 RepID=UPI00198012B6|nr:FAD-binding and (Fe-S)-binding domain-containing protein [Thermoactinospora rubra]